MPPDSEPRLDRSLSLDTLADRLGVTPAAVVSGLLAVLAAGAGAWWALRGPEPPPVESVLPVAGAVTVATPSTTTTLAAPLVVHVDGEVTRPGVHEVSAGARVIDAIEAAGGMTGAADRSRVNLAAVVRDGERLWIPGVDETEPPVVAGGGGPSDEGEVTPAAPVDLNSADRSRLEELPGIGPSLAAAIIEHRNRAGPFRAVEGLLDVAGIGPAKLEQIRRLVTV